MPDTIPAGARGTLVTFTIIRKAPAAFAGDGVYAVAVVDLTGGKRVVGRIAPFEPAPRLGAAVKPVGRARETPVFAAE